MSLKQNFECPSCRHKFILDYSKAEKDKTILCPNCSKRHTFVDNKLTEMSKIYDGIVEAVIAAEKKSKKE